MKNYVLAFIAAISIQSLLTNNTARAEASTLNSSFTEGDSSDLFMLRKIENVIVGVIFDQNMNTFTTEEDFNIAVKGFPSVEVISNEEFQERSHQARQALSNSWTMHDPDATMSWRKKLGKFADKHAGAIVGTVVAPGTGTAVGAGADKAREWAEKQEKDRRAAQEKARQEAERARHEAEARARAEAESARLRVELDAVSRELEAQIMSARAEIANLESSQISPELVAQIKTLAAQHELCLRAIPRDATPLAARAGMHACYSALRANLDATIPSW